MNELALPMRQRVERLERMLENTPQVDCPVRHHFAPGLYAREMTIPAGVIATGAVHKTEHMTIVVGHCWLTTEDGARELIGHNTLTSKPGIKRAVHTITDTVITTFHVTPETDLDKLCAELTESTSAQLLGGSENRQLTVQRQQELESQ